VVEQELHISRDTSDIFIPLFVESSLYPADPLLLREEMKVFLTRSPGRILFS
jgi:hypothetical protein